MMNIKLFKQYLFTHQKVVKESSHGYDDSYSNKKYTRADDPHKQALETINQLTKFVKTYNVDFRVSSPKITLGNRTEYKSKGFDYKIEVDITANNTKFKLEIIKDRWIKDRGAMLGIPQPIRVHYWTIDLLDKSGKLIRNFGGPKYLRNFTDSFPPDYREFTARINLMLRTIYQIPPGQPWKGNK